MVRRHDWSAPTSTALSAPRCSHPYPSLTCSYATLWNVFKSLAASHSHDEKTALFSGTAARVYR